MLKLRKVVAGQSSLGDSHNCNFLDCNSSERERWRNDLINPHAAEAACQLGVG